MSISLGLGINISGWNCRNRTSIFLTEKLDAYSNINLNLKPHESNMRNNNFCWVNFVMFVVFLYKQFFCPRSNIFIFCYLIQLSVAMHMLGFPYRSVNFNRSLKTCPENDFFTIETLRITKNINELFLETSFKLFSVSKMKNKNNYLYLKIYWSWQVISTWILGLQIDIK